MVWKEKATCVFSLLAKKFAAIFAVLLFAKLTLLAPHFLHAAPFSDFFDYTQPDNTIITLRGEGDEFHADFETTSGFSVVFDPLTKAYYYAKRASDGESLQSTGVMAHDHAPPGLSQHLRANRSSVAKRALERRRKWEADSGITERWNRLKSQNLSSMVLSDTSVVPDGTSPESAPPTSTTTGEKIGLTLLIDFSDAPATIPQSNIEAFLNADNYVGYGNNGSVKEYFRDVSAGRLTYTNVATIYIRMTQPRSYYNDTSKDSGDQGRLLIVDALKILKERSDYNNMILPAFNSLTTDSSNRVVAFNVFFAGSSSGVWSKGLWPHSWALSSSVSLGNGKSVYKYQITNVGTSLSLGTFAHENGHMLCGFPDLYDYESDSKGGAGNFSLMGSGSNLGSGKNPSQVDAYLKLAAGWATVIDLNSSSNLTGTLVAAPNNGYNTFYRYRKPGTSTEYFLLENRQKTGRDAKLPASGIAIWHVDQLGSRDNQSLLPNTTHQNYELTLVQADNLWDFEKNVDSGDPYDLYYLGNTATGYTNRFDDSSAPNGHWWDGSNSGIMLSLFNSSSMSMTFFVGIQTTVPVPPTISSVTAGNGQASVYYVPPISDGGSPITVYEVTSSGGATFLTNTIPATVTGLQNGNGYTFVVRAVNAVGKSSASASSNIIVPGVALVSGDDTSGYQSLQSAYESADEGKTIKVLGNSSFDEFSVTTANSKGDVRIVGGYDDAFSQSVGLPARVGRISLSAGTTRFENVVVGSP